MRRGGIARGEIIYFTKQIFIFIIVLKYCVESNLIYAVHDEVEALAIL